MVAVSVLMPIKGDCRFLFYAVESVRLQSGVTWELIICKDQIDSTASSYLERVASEDYRIKIVDTPGMTLPDALNRGLDECQGEFIARFDADDIMLPGRLIYQTNFLLGNADYVCCGGQILIISDTNKLRLVSPYYNLRNKTLKAKLISRCPFPHPGVMIRTESLRLVGGYSRGFKYAEDYELWLKLAHVGKFNNLPRKVIAYRKYNNQTSVRFKKETRLFIAIALLFEIKKNSLEKINWENFNIDFFQREYLLLDFSKRKKLKRLFSKDKFIPKETQYRFKLEKYFELLSDFFYLLFSIPKRLIHLFTTLLNSISSLFMASFFWKNYIKLLRKQYLKHINNIENMEKK